VHSPADVDGWRMITGNPHVTGAQGVSILQLGFSRSCRELGRRYRTSTMGLKVRVSRSERGELSNEQLLVVRGEQSTSADRVDSLFHGNRARVGGATG
jgi:hypothetical protein